MKAAVPVQPGDVLAVRSKGFSSAAIRLGAALLGEPNLENHIAVVHHVDDAGTTWCVEGRPGGVGWRDARDYLGSRWTMSNATESKSGRQRDLVRTAVFAALGTKYDWEGIAADAATALRLPDLWREKWGGKVPGHVVCSSLAAWAYQRAGLPYPVVHDLARTTPADWSELIIERGWSGLG